MADKASDVLTRSRGRVAVFSIKDNAPEELYGRLFDGLIALEVPSIRHRGYLEEGCDGLAFLDGGLFIREQTFTFGGLDGQWLYGTHAIALACDQAQLQRPRNLDAPSHEELLEALAFQIQHESHVLDDRLDSIRHVVDLADLDLLAAGQPTAWEREMPPEIQRLMNMQAGRLKFSSFVREEMDGVPRLGVEFFDDGALGLTITESTGPGHKPIFIGGPADWAGLQSGDKVLSLAETPVKAVPDLHAILAGCKQGQTVALEYERDGEVVKVDVEL